MKTVTCLLALALVAFSATPTRAETLIFVEDFSDESGDPAFDPLFNHFCVVDDPEGNYWGIGGTDPRLMLVPGLADTITFNVQPEWTVTTASVESFDYKNAVRFIGTEGTLAFGPQVDPFEPPLLWEATAQQIGVITAIELSASQGVFDNVTIEVVVPEPSAAVLLATGLLVGLMGLSRRRLA